MPTKMYQNLLMVDDGEGLEVQTETARRSRESGGTNIHDAGSKKLGQ